MWFPVETEGVVGKRLFVIRSNVRHKWVLVRLGRLMCFAQAGGTANIVVAETTYYFVPPGGLVRLQCEGLRVGTGESFMSGNDRTGLGEHLEPRAMRSCIVGDLKNQTIPNGLVMENKVVLDVKKG